LYVNKKIIFIYQQNSHYLWKCGRIPNIGAFLALKNAPTAGVVGLLWTGNLVMYRGVPLPTFVREPSVADFAKNEGAEALTGNTERGTCTVFPTVAPANY
jgi:hypothetical protein